jgi:hypothetical protein
MNFDTNTKLNIILAILAIILVLAMILVFRGTGEGYASCGGKSESYGDPYGLYGTPVSYQISDELPDGYHQMPDGRIMKDSDHQGYAVTCPNAACNDKMCEFCKARQGDADAYKKGGCAVCGL